MLVPVISFLDMQMIVVVFSHSIVNSVLTSILVWMGIISLSLSLYTFHKF